MLRRESEYGQRVARVLELKRTLGTDSWAGWLPASEMTELMERAAQRASEAIANPELPAREFAAYLKQAALDGFFGGFLQPEYASAFRGLSENDIDRVLASFALENCRRNEPLLELVRKHMAGARA
jgi:endoglucanase